MADAIFMLTFIFFLGFCFYLGLVGRSFWLILLIAACIFIALNMAEIIYPLVPDMPRANVIGLSVLIFLIYLIPVASSFGLGFLARYFTKPAFGGGSVNLIEWSLIGIVTISVFSLNVYWRANANDPGVSQQSQPGE